MRTDEKILELLADTVKGDDLAFERLTVIYSSLIESSAHSAVAFMERSGLEVSLDDVEDMKQEARLALYRAALKYDPAGDGLEVTFGLYAKICVRNAMTSQIRRLMAKKRRMERQAHKELSEVAVVSSAALSRSTVDALIRERGDTLSSYERSVLCAYAEGKKIPEIAEELGKDVKSINNALYRIRVKLKG